MKLYVKNSNKEEIEDGVIFELQNLDELKKTLNEISESIPTPHVAVRLNYQIIDHGTIYKGTTLVSTYGTQKDEMDPASTYLVTFKNWKLGGHEANPYLEFEVIKK